MFEFKKSTKFMIAFAGSIETIKGYLCDIGNTYLLICYNVWEIDSNKSYERAGYKNIVDAMEKELGFKKSTTYNMIKVAKTYGTDTTGKVTLDHLLTYTKYSFSQLVEMLSLGSDQRKLITPETSVSAIRMLKKSDKAPEPEAPSAPVPDKPEKFQTSGKSSPAVNRSEVLETVSFSAPDNADVQFQYSINIEDGELCCFFDKGFEKFLDRFVYDLDDLSVALYPDTENFLRGYDFDRFNPDDFEERFSYIIHCYRSAYNAYKKQKELQDKSAV